MHAHSFDCPAREDSITTRIEIQRLRGPTVDEILSGRPDGGEPLVLDRRYRLLRSIGRGGVGRVYLAEDLETGNELALKILDTRSRDWAASLAGFVREARLATRVFHPNVVQMYLCDSTMEGVVYSTMELLHGHTLERMLGRDPLPWASARRLLLQLCAGLEAIHRAGVVHRDVKPGNCFVLEPEASLVILDFGNAVLEGQRSQDPFPALIGTPHYMAPEHIRGEPLDGRADLYSVGVMAFELLTGRTPFSGDTPGDIHAQHLDRDPPSLANVAPDIELPDGIETLVRRALAKRPEARFPNARTLADALATV